MENIIKLYEDAFRQYGDSQHAVLCPKGRQGIRFQSLTHHINRNEEKFSLLDYGCGLAHLKPFLDERYQNVNYVGADAVDVFIQACQAKYPQARFLNAKSPENINEEYDYIVSAGAFNMLYNDDLDIHRTIVFDIIEQLFTKAKVYLSINMMTDIVDFRQSGAYHQNIIQLYNFVFDKLSRRLVIDQSYMPYEFTLTVWKDQYIQRPANLYGSE
jgi:trans-aconitate methyltransferase